MEFQWERAERGHRIEAWIDRMCLTVPSVMFDVLKAGIGDLDTWFSDGGRENTAWDIASCGCLVGAAALAAKNLKGAVQCISEHVNGYPNEAAWVLYLAICAAKGKRPISHTKLDQKRPSWCLPGALHFLADVDPETTDLPRDLVDTYQVGVYVMEEGNTVEIDGHWISQGRRRTDVIDYIMDRIITNLAMMQYRSLRTLQQHKQGALPIPVRL